MGTVKRILARKAQRAVLTTTPHTLVYDAIAVIAEHGLTVELAPR